MQQVHAVAEGARQIDGLLANFSALYYRASESGWGINFQQQGLILYGTWFTYDSANNAIWYVMPNMSYRGGGYFEGPVYATTGVPLHQINGSPATRTVTEVGIAGMTWTLLWAQVVEAIVLLIIAAVLFDLVYPRTAAQSGQSLG